MTIFLNKKKYFVIRRIRIRILFWSDSDPCESDPDPKHWLEEYTIFSFSSGRGFGYAENFQVTIYLYYTYHNLVVCLDPDPGHVEKNCNEIFLFNFEPLLLEDPYLNLLGS